MEVKLIVLEGKQKDREIPLPETIFLIGRDRQCHIRPHCQSVSQLHCAVAAWAGRVRVRDLNSRNGTFVNGQAIDGEVTVADGDQLRVGTLVFAIRITTEEGAILPAPLTDERQVQWLLDSPGDSAVLGSDTQAVPMPPAGAAEEAIPEPETGRPEPAAVSEAEVGGSKAVSAGQNLRDYFEIRKHPS